MLVETVFFGGTTQSRLLREALPLPKFPQVFPLDFDRKGVTVFRKMYSVRDNGFSPFHPFVNSSLYNDL